VIHLPGEATKTTSCLSFFVAFVLFVVQLPFWDKAAARRRRRLVLAKRGGSR
jgi:hypothetical protein